MAIVACSSILSRIQTRAYIYIYIYIISPCCVQRISTYSTSKYGGETAFHRIELLLSINSKGQTIRGSETKLLIRYRLEGGGGEIRVNVGRVRSVSYKGVALKEKRKKRERKKE